MINQRMKPEKQIKKRFGKFILENYQAIQKDEEENDTTSLIVATTIVLTGYVVYSFTC